MKERKSLEYHMYNFSWTVALPCRRVALLSSLATPFITRLGIANPMTEASAAAAE